MSPRPKKPKSAPAEPPDVTPVSASGLKPVMTAAALRAWAEEHQVAHWLPVLALQALRKAPGVDPYWLQYGRGSAPYTLEQVLTVPQARSLQWGREALTLPVKQAAIAVLEREVGRVRTALREESERLRRWQPPPEGSARRQLWDRVRALRDQVRSHTQPRTLPLQRFQYLRLIVEPPSADYREPVTALCGGGRQKPVLTIGLGGETASVGCDCGGPNSGRCSMALSAVDTLLEALCAPHLTEMVENFARGVTAPPWQRLIRRLDEALAPPKKTRASAPEEEQAELGWRIETDETPPGLRPVWCTPYKRKAGYSRRNAHVWEVLGSDRTLESDQAAALLLTGGDRYMVHDSSHKLRRLRALWELAGHPRLFLDQESLPGSLERGELALRCTQTKQGRLVLSLVLGELEVPVDRLGREDSVWMESGFLLWFDSEQRRGRIAHCRPEQKRVLEVLMSSPGKFDRELLPALTERLGVLETTLPVQLGEGLGGREVPADPRIRLELELEAEGELRVEARLQPLPGGAIVQPGHGLRELYGVDERGTPIHVRRDLHAERPRVLEALAGLPLGPPAEQGPELLWRLDEPERMLELLLALQAGDERWAVYWNRDQPLQISRPATAADLRLKVRQNRDWLGIEGSIEIEGVEVALADLLEAVRAGRRFVRVSDRMFVQLEHLFSEQLAQAAEGVYARRDRLEVGLLHAPAFQALADAGAELSAPARWQGLLEALQQAAAVQPEVPASLRADLRPYQRAGFEWLARLAEWAPGACLADDMGLGKTVQALALLLRRAEQGPALVVAPTSVCSNWLREAARFAPGLRPLSYRGPERAALLAELRPGDLVITSYGLVVRDLEVLAAQRFTTLVWDEAQALKNPESLRAKAAARLDAGFHLALTGTPVENRTGELWSLFRVLLPGLLGSQEHFRERFVLPIERDADLQRRRMLARIVRPFVLRRHKTEVERELPARTEIDRTVTPGTEERKLYERVRLETLLKLASQEPGTEQQKRFQVLAALTRLRQIACHPRLYDADWQQGSAKLEALRELVAELRAEGHQILVFSQFTSLLALAREALAQDGVRLLTLEGSTPEARRQELVDRFQAGGADVFLISLRAGGFGLNLTAATYVVLLDPWWNPAVEAQAADRTHRIGQTRPVTIYRLIAEGTIEQAILEMQAQKRELVEGLLEGTGQAAPISTEELLDLMQQAIGSSDADES